MVFALNVNRWSTALKKKTIPVVNEVSSSQIFLNKVLASTLFTVIEHAALPLLVISHFIRFSAFDTFRPRKVAKHSLQ
jgi:hypothetical protein